MSASHLHYCDSCGDVLYRCDETVIRDDSSASCANAPVGAREYCEACCVPNVDTDDDQTSTDDIASVEELRARLAYHTAKYSDREGVTCA